MLTYREYRQFAETCVGWAREAKSTEERGTFIEMAAAWTILAAKDEQASVARTIKIEDAIAPARLRSSKRPAGTPHRRVVSG
jgi:hypothetical protein